MNEMPEISHDRRAAVRGMLIERIEAAPVERRRLVVRSIAVAAASVVVLGGAGFAVASRLPPEAPHGGTAIAPPVTSATPRTSAAPSTEPTPEGTPGLVNPAGTPSSTPIPTLDLSSPGSWIITGQGVGPLTMGGNQVEQAEQMAVAYDVKPQAYTCPVNFYMAKSGGSAPDFVTESVVDGRIDMILIGDISNSPEKTEAYRTSSPKTSAGIGIGSTLDQLKSAYPGLTGETGLYGPDGLFSRSVGNGNFVSFEMDATGHVAQINVTTTPFPHGEFC